MPDHADRPSPPSRYALLIVLLVAVAAGCSGVRGPSGGPAGAIAAPADPATEHLAEHLEERALLLLLADRRTYEPLVVRRSLAGPPALREELAVALGRSGDPGGLDPLLGLLLDDRAPVRRAAAFALGELGEGLPASRTEERRRAAARLLDAVVDPDRRVGALAVEALGKLGVTVAPVAGRTGELEAEERWARLLPSLFRFPDPETPGLATEALDWLARESPEEALELGRWAVYALTREPRPEALETVRGLLGPSAGDLEAAWIARALGRIGTGSRDLALLGPLLDRPEPEPVLAALAAARALVADGRAAAPDSWRPRLAELLEDPRPGVRMVAIDAASAWLLDPVLSGLLAEGVSGPHAAAERGAALVALATGGDPRAEGLAAAAAGAPEPRLRARAAEAAGVLGASAILDRLADDRSPVVRQAVLAARLARATGSEERTAALVRSALRDPDAGVRTAALDRLADRPLLPVAELTRAWGRAHGSADGVIEEPLAAVAALVARGEAVPTEGASGGRGEREAATEALLEIASESEHAVRVRAADGLARLGLPRPAVGAVESARSVGVYRRIVLETGAPRTVEMRTEKGSVTIRLDCPRAPLTCLNFLRLSAQGFYDGLDLHRVVPGFVVQGGDPRGDGLGGPGYVIRDEINRLRFGGDEGAGVLGMALAGPDTGGSQFFVTLSPQPHLDGAYTAFGRVVAGQEVLERILPGDRIEQIREVAGTGWRDRAGDGERSGDW